MKDKIPVIGNWYQNVRDEEVFEIVAINESDKTIDIQFTDGRIDELDYADWQSTPLVACAAPNDWQEILATEADLNPFDETREPVDPWILIDGLDDDIGSTDYL